VQGDRFAGRADGGHFLQQAGDLLQCRLRALERVVEHRHLVHRLEEALGGQDQGKQHPDGEFAAEHPEAAGEQDDGDADVADQHQARLEDAVEVDGAHGDPAVVLGEFGIAGGILALLAEGLDRADSGHGLHEVHDQAGGDHPGFAECDLRVFLVPAGQEVHRHAGSEHKEPAAPVEHEHRDGREHHEQEPGGQ
jgi:hypothetical protein